MNSFSKELWGSKLLLSVFLLLAFASLSFAAADITINNAKITSSNTVLVTFNDPGQNLASVDFSKWHIDTADGGTTPLTPTSADVTSAGTPWTVTLTFAGTPFSNTATAFSAVLGLYVDASGVTDSNGIPDTNAVVAHDASIAIADGQTPTFTAIRTALNTIVLTFSENVDTTTTSGEGYAVAGGTVTANTDPAGGSTSMTLTTTGLTATDGAPAVTYTIAAGTTVDASAALNEVANGATANAADQVTPTFTAIRTALNTIVLTISEPVTGTAILNSFTVVGASAVTNTAPTASTTITLTTTGLTATDGAPAVAYVSATGNILDNSAATNEMANGATANAADQVKPTVTSATLNYGTGVLVVTFSETVDASATDATKFHINDVTGTDVVTLSVAPTDTDATTLTFTLTEAQRVAALAKSGTTGGNLVAVVLDVDALGVTDMATNTNLIDDANVVTETADTTKPTVTSATLNYNTGVLVVTLSETVDASATDATKFHINDVTGTDVVTLSAAPTDTDATTLTFTLTEAQRVAAWAKSGVAGGNGGAVVLDVDAAGVTDMATNTNLVDDNNAVTETAVTLAISSVSPSSNAADSVSVATFTGFVASESLTATIDGVSAGSTTANSTGGGTINVTFPGARNPGSYYLIITGSLGSASTSVTLLASSSSSSSSSSTTTTTTYYYVPPTTTTTTTPTTTTTTTIPTTTAATVTQAQSTISSANAAIAAGNVDTAASLLTSALNNVGTVITPTTTTATLAQTQTIMANVVNSADSLITSGSTTQAATVLSEVTVTANSLTTAGSSAQASVAVADVITSAGKLLTAGDMTSAQSVLASVQTSTDKLVTAATAITDSMTTSGINLNDALGLSDLGLSAADISAAENKAAQASALMTQAQTETDATQKSALLTQAAQLQKEALQSLPEIKEVASATATSTVTSATIASASAAATTNSAKAAVSAIQTASAAGGDIIVQKDLASYKISNKDVADTEVDRSVITLKFRADKQLNNVRIVESISKNVVQSATELVFSGGIQPTILQDDPIVAWTFSSMSSGETKEVSYTVKKNVETLDSVSLAAGDVIAPSEESTTTTTTTTTTTQAKGIDTGTILMGIVVIVILVAGYYMFLGKKGKYPGFKKK